MVDDVAIDNREVARGARTTIDYPILNEQDSVSSSQLLPHETSRSRVPTFQVKTEIQAFMRNIQVLKC